MGMQDFHKAGMLKMILKSIFFYRKDAVYQVIITILLSAIITGSLLTGHSVRSSLRKTTYEKLGNTDIILSSGLRYFDASLAGRISLSTGDKSAALLETEGYCSNFATGTTALNVKIYGITDDFFSFHGVDPVLIKTGETLINSVLAKHLGIAEGDEMIIHFREADPLPANAPFAPSKDENGSMVMKVTRILGPEQAGNFSPGVSQHIPGTIFLNIADLGSAGDSIKKANRIIVKKEGEANYYNVLASSITPGDIGLTVRRSSKTGEPEIISDRIFLDNLLVSDILRKIPSGKPVLTYLVNNFTVNGRSTPYSFVSALPSGLYPGIDTDAIIINKWLAEDLDASTGETITLRWYDPSINHKLEEKERDFYISEIVQNNSLYSDPALMPDFPGISGSVTCSGWDAGVPILMDQIRDKDEAYWNTFRGTPKAFVSYESGKMMWGNNFGTATAIRFPVSMTEEEITGSLTGSFNPETVGFTVTNVRETANKGADESVDFSSLFLSLSFFMILSCIILFSLALSMYFDSRKNQTGTLVALGFRNRFIRKLLFTETLFLSIAGAIPGLFLGYLVNMLIIRALNSVWTGAVQTSSLTPDFSIIPMVYGFLAVLIIASVIILIKSATFLKNLTRPATGELKKHSPRNNLIVFIVFLAVTIILLVAAIVLTQNSTPLYFLAGSFLLAALVTFIRYAYVKEVPKSSASDNMKSNIRRKYYSFHPSHIVTPVIFIAAGIFAVMITGANRMVLTDKMLRPEGGTGGYLLWAESAVPVKTSLNSPEGQKEFGLGEEDLKDLEIMQAGRVSGDDASCLNLNMVSSPPLLGVDASAFMERGSFSFASRLRKAGDVNPWELLEKNPGQNTIYGIADQTVLQWGLKKRTGDTMIFRAENGQPLNVIICAGLKSSVFQGYLLISNKNLSVYFPSVEGASVFLIDGKTEFSELYRNTLNERLSGYGFSTEDAGEKLASFFQVTNTYLNVFAVLGAFGMIMGIAGLGFVLLRNYNSRKREFAFLSATGFPESGIRNLILKDQLIILLWGVITGTVSGLTATLPSILSGNEMPWLLILIMILSIIISGTAVLFMSVRSIRSNTLISQLRKE